LREWVSVVFCVTDLTGGIKTPFFIYSEDIKTGATTISDYALVQRQFQIFERAVNKFKSDVALWVQYIEVAKKEGARALVGRITARCGFQSDKTYGINKLTPA